MGNQLNLPPDVPSDQAFQRIAISVSDALTHRFAEGLEELRGKRMVCEEGMGKNTALEAPLGAVIEEVEYPPSSQAEKLVIAVDSSTILLGAAEGGGIYATRVAVVSSKRGKGAGYARLGPYINHLNPSSLIIPQHSDDQMLKRLVLMDEQFGGRLLRTYAERLIQITLARNLSDSLILIDGSLKCSAFEPPYASLAVILHEARRNCNHVLGISKTTRIPGLEMSQIKTRKKPPAYIDIHHQVMQYTSGLLGKALLVKFADDGVPLRVDLDPSDARESISEVVFNDRLYWGYPETLRLAHHMSTITCSEKICLKSYLEREAGAIILASTELRKALLGRISFRLGASR